MIKIGEQLQPEKAKIIGFAFIINRRIIKQSMDRTRMQELKDIVLGQKRNSKKESKTRLSQKQDALNQFQEKETEISIFSLSFFQFNSREEAEELRRQAVKAVYYAVNKIKVPSIQILESRRVKIPDSNKKILFLDLDETLIRSIYGPKKAQNHFISNGIEFNFNIRPFCQHFLKKMANLFDVYIFTAGTKEYALPIVQYLNKDINVIKGVLHRAHCLKTKNGVYIKDLRIIKGRNLAQMAIIDNNIRSFSFQLENGIPVQSYFGCPKDRILLKLASFLKKLAQQSDIPNFLTKTLNLRTNYLESFKKNSLIPDDSQENCNHS